MGNAESTQAHNATAPDEQAPQPTNAAQQHQQQQQQLDTQPHTQAKAPSPQAAAQPQAHQAQESKSESDHAVDKLAASPQVAPSAAAPSTTAPAAPAVAPLPVDPASLPLLGSQSPSGSPDPANAPASSAVPAASTFRSTVGAVGVGEDHLDLWYALVEWSCSSLAAGVVLAWDSEEVGHRVLALPSSPELLSALAQKQTDRKRARIDAAKQRHLEEQTKANRRDMSTDALIPIELQPLATPVAAESVPAPSAPVGDPVPFHLASELLQVDRPLAQLRHTFVPSRVSEDTFWQCYFDAINRTIHEHVLSLQQPEDQLQDTNPHAEQLQEAKQ
jgi:hypothetical protein